MAVQVDDPLGGTLVERRPLVWILPLSAGIAGFLIWLIYLKSTRAAAPPWIDLLPAANAFFNTCSACALAGGWLSIKRGNRDRHMRFMLAAVTFSALFLVSYVVYHNFHGDTRFPGQGWIRPVYFSILISHIGLSIVALPMILSTLFYAATARYASHRRIARFTLPIWFYVSVTGVVVFAVLRAYL
jgi:putative membrane protein